MEGSKIAPAPSADSAPEARLKWGSYETAVSRVAKPNGFLPLKLRYLGRARSGAGNARLIARVDHLALGNDVSWPDFFWHLLQARNHRSDQSHAHRASGRSLRGRPPHHHRGDHHCATAGRSRLLSRRVQREVECFGCDRLILMTTGKHAACGAVLHYANTAHFICAVWRLSKSCRP